jgi:hypothetical protein
MRPVPISKLPEEERQQFLDDLNYLNTTQIKCFCKWHMIPYQIAVEAPNGIRRRTKEDDRKGVILDRIRHFLQTGVVLNETCFPRTVVSLNPLPEKITADDRLFYGQYDKANPAMIALLKDLTGGRFSSGAIARILARRFWSSGEAPTFREFAAAWIEASDKHTRPNPEWAFLSDRASQAAIPDWKKFRARKASKTIKVLDQIIPVVPSSSRKTK